MQVQVQLLMGNKIANPNQIISLPNGGGAIKGIGETFQPNLFSGTCNFAVPIAVSPGRGGFEPKLVLQYSTGAGNGLFGLGWQLTIPRITRKTEKGLPRYDHTDTYIMSGTEDLVPYLKETTDPQTGDVEWIKDQFEDVNHEFTITRFRPRTEGLFARIERWVHRTSGDAHWRTTTKDNLTSIYGHSSQSRISNPIAPEQIYEWLLEETFDSKGNHLRYEYARDSADLVINEIYEQNRTYCQRYIRRIFYGNVPDGVPSGVLVNSRRYMFELVFDYGDQDTSYQPALAAQEIFSASSPPLRPDPFSTYRSRFEIRTLRRCERVLVYHHFAELQEPTLVTSTDLHYDTNPDTDLSLLTSVIVTRYQRHDTGYTTASMPPVSFTYSEFRPHQQHYQPLQARGNNLPSVALNKPDITLVDLFGDGLLDILQTSFDGFRYWKNLGGGLLDYPRFLQESPAGLTLAQPGVGFGDMDGDGRVELLVHSGTQQGFYEATPHGTWQQFKKYPTMPQFDHSDPNVRLVDLTGDGRSDVLMTCDDCFLWFECLGDAGFGDPHYVTRLHNLDQFPDVFFNDPSGRVQLADMNGDGLQDIVLLHKGRIDYWPNLGYGRFGARITMRTLDDAPMLQHTFNPSRQFLVDLDGTGCADLVYVDFDCVHFWFNQSGNSWSSRQTIYGTPMTNDVTTIQFADILGTGAANLIWSYDYGTIGGSNYKALDFCGGVKPYLLTEMCNNLGATTRVCYAASTKFAREDAANGHPWATPLPFPVHVLDKVETIDHISHTKLVTTYTYHHGYFDGREREFRGFGRVDRCDSEEFDVFSQHDLHSEEDFSNGQATYHVPPVLTKTWFHTGAFIEGRQIMEQYRQEFFTADTASFDLDPHNIPIDSPPHSAHRALRGSTLRVEVYALDGTAKQEYPYVLAETAYTVLQVQPGSGDVPPVYLTVPRESLSYHYERNPNDPRIDHQLTLQVDDFGNITDGAAIAYPRRGNYPDQNRLAILYTHNDYINQVTDANFYYASILCQTRNYEVTGIDWTAGQSQLAQADFASLLVTSLAPGTAGIDYLPYEQPVANGQPAKRLIHWIRSYFRDDTTATFIDIDPTHDPVRLLANRLVLGEIQSLAMPYESYQAAFTDDQLEVVYGRNADNTPRMTRQMLTEGGYHYEDGYWWIPSGQQNFNMDKFYLTEQQRDPFGNDIWIAYDDYALLTVSAVDSLSNLVKAHNDYRVLQPYLIIDPNGNLSQAAFDTLGLVVATAISDGSATGDSLLDFVADLTDIQLAEFAADPHGHSVQLLGMATTRTIYDLHRYGTSRDPLQPVYSATLVRESHTSELPAGEEPIVQVGFSYSDGFGRAIQQKRQTEPGVVFQRDSSGQPIFSGNYLLMTSDTVSSRWVSTGWTIYNNKGNPVRQYEPYFTDTHNFEFDIRLGVGPTIFYDPLGRIIGTLRPDHTYDKVNFTSWQHTTWDVNDTLHPPDANGIPFDPADDPDIGAYISKLPIGDYLPTWYDVRTSPANALTMWPDVDAQGQPLPDNIKRRAKEGQAAQQAIFHANTPYTAYLDTLGRTFLTIARNSLPSADEHHTRTILDIEGNQLAVIDARGNPVLINAIVQRTAQGKPVSDFDGNLILLAYAIDMAGRQLHSDSMDAGQRWLFCDVNGSPLYSWDSRQHRLRRDYDTLRRPTHLYVMAGDEPEILVERTVYGEGHPDSHSLEQALNLRGQVYLQLDSAGIVTYTSRDPQLNEESYDFKGNALHVVRQFARHFNGVVDWSAVETLLAPPLLDLAAVDVGLAPLLESERFSTSTMYDALNRPVTITTPDHSITRSTYNEAGLLSAVEVNLRGEIDNGQREWTPFVTNIDYDEKGQRVRIDYGNRTSTTYSYDPLSSRLTRLRTIRDDRFSTEAQLVQELVYTYDPVGNITHLRDAAQPQIFFENDCIDASTDYKYDALYRLIAAQGREHRGQEHQPEWDEQIRTGQPIPYNCQDIRHYVESYRYDQVGNILQMVHHIGADIDQPGQVVWNRHYQYRPDCNHLLCTSLPGDNTVGVPDYTLSPAYTQRYTHDAHGNLIAMSHLPLMVWNYRDQLEAVSPQVVNDGRGETTYYVYDSKGQRVRKVTVRPQSQQELDSGLQPRRVKERFYLGGFEIYREYIASSPDPSLERETLHIMDDTQRIALVETKTIDNGAPINNPPPLTRYQISNHLDTACLELSESGEIISYEEYYPFGSTSYQAADNAIEVGAKRYRYSGKERDEESGLYYYGARYYASWLGRWMSCDPDSRNRTACAYRYCQNSPICLLDRMGGTEEIKGSWIEITIDHIFARANGGAHVDPENLSFLPRSDNSSKKDKLEGVRSRIEPQSLAKAAEEGQFSKAAQKMMSQSFAETEEVTRLWDKASKGRTLSYDTARDNFWDMVIEGSDPDAKLVKQAFDAAGVHQIAGKQGFAIDAVATGLQTRWTRAEALQKLKEMGKRAIKTGGTKIRNVARALGPVGMLLAGLISAGEVHAAEPEDQPRMAAEATGSLIGGEIGAAIGAGIALLAVAAVGALVAIPTGIAVAVLTIGTMIGGYIGSEKGEKGGTEVYNAIAESSNESSPAQSASPTLAPEPQCNIVVEDGKELFINVCLGL